MTENNNEKTNNKHQQLDCYDEVTHTLDIRSNGLYPSSVLSNLCSNGFRFDGRVCGSMEGFLQSLKYQDVDKQRQICSMKGGNARKRSVTSWQTDQIVWWKGCPVDRQGQEYQELLRRAYQAMFDQSQRFRDALMQTRGMNLVHTLGNDDAYRTILTAHELCAILTEMREAYDARDKQLAPLPRRVFVVMDVLFDNRDISLSALHREQQDNLQPRLAAMKAMQMLRQHYDVYVLSEYPCDNLAACADFMQWATEQWGEDFRHHLLFAPNGAVCNGDYLVEKENGHYAPDFEGVCLQWGSAHFPDWQSIVDYFLADEH